MAKHIAWLLLLGLCCLCGCAGRTVNDPAALQQSQAAINAFAAGRATYWKEGMTRVTASIQPESKVLFSALSVNFTFQSIYRTYPDGSTKFVMFMPQGTRLGSCERSAAGALTCQQLPLPEVEDVVRHSFAALDDLMASAPRPDDLWSLQYGDRLGGVSSDNLVAVREQVKNNSGPVHAVYSTKGFPLVLYQSSENIVQWKMRFKTPDSPDAAAFYQYKNKNSKWQYNVNILEVK